jgi:4-hydroxybenzoate polyprenyltransferase
MYSFKIIPERIAQITGITRLKEIPGSKTMFTAVAWGVLAALIPVVCSDRGSSGATAIAFFFVAGMIFIRSGLFEIIAIEGDRVVGKETLAIALGKERTLNLLSIGSLMFIAMLLWAAWAGVIPTLGYILSLSGVYMLCYLIVYRRFMLESSLILESLVEGNMILAGMLAFLWDPYNLIFR